MPPDGLDLWEWVHGRLTEGLPDHRVVSELAGEPTGPDAAKGTVVWSLVCREADPLGAWEAALTIVLLARADKVADGVRDITAAVEGWRTPGPLHDVERDSIQGVRAATGKGLRQFTFAYTLTWTV